MESTLLPGALSDSIHEVQNGVDGCAAVACDPPASSATEKAITDAVLASIDSRLKALQAASLRLEESQHANFGLVMDAISQLHSGEASSPLDSPRSAATEDWRSRRNMKSTLGASRKTLTRPPAALRAVSLSGKQKDAARVGGSLDIMSQITQAFDTTPSRSRSPAVSTSPRGAALHRLNSLAELHAEPLRPCPEGLREVADPCTSASMPHSSGHRSGDGSAFDATVGENPKVTVLMEDAVQPPEPRAAYMDAPGTDPPVMGTSRKVDFTPEASPSRGGRAADGKASLKLPPAFLSKGSGAPEASFSRELSATSGVCRSNSGGSGSIQSPSSGQGAQTLTPAHGQSERASDTERGPSSAWASMGLVRRSPSARRDVSRVNQVLEGRAEWIARAATLGAGNTLLEDEVELPRFMLPPQSPVHNALAALLAVSVVYTGLLSPIVLAYFHGGAISPSWSILVHVADALWLVFILVAFRTAIYDARGSVIVDAWRIAAHYARTWLLMDLLSAWPAFLASEGTAAYSACMLLKLSRTPRLAPLISLFQKQYQAHYLAPLKWGLMILLLSHSMACIWRLVQCDLESHLASGVSQDSLDSYCEGAEWWHMYVSDMYWMTMTLSTIGYGDIYPYNTLARLFAIFVMFLGPIFFGSVVAGLSHVMNKLFDETVESSVATMSQFMRRHRVPLGLQRRVERSLRQVLNSEVSTSPLDPDLFARLSPVLQRTFSFAILNGTIGRFPLFKGAIHSFVAEIAQAHMLVHCSADDLVGEAGQLVEDMVFVVNGKLVACFSASWPDRLDVPVEELAQDGDGLRRLMTQYAPVATSPTAANGFTDNRRTMGRGAWFGEACVVNRQHVRTANFIAQGVSELAVLNKEEYVRAMNRYPAMLKRHARFVDGIDQGTISLADISWTPARVQRSSWRQQRSTWARATRQQRSTVY